MPRNVAFLWAVLAAARVAPSAAVEEGMRPPLKEMWPWYHSADEIHNTLQELASNCKGADIEISQRSEINAADAAGQLVQLDVVHISRSSSKPKVKAMMIFGEHAREVISPESALDLVEALCGNGPDAERAGKVLDGVSFTIVPNANPLSRKKVEQGYYCKRTNEDGVDLNRNFGDDHRTGAGAQPGDEQNPGPNGFSEPETRILKGLIDEERPNAYLSIHSGAYLLGTPFGYTSSRTPETETSMMEVLRPISEKYCGGNCPYGNLAELINYENPGCDIDYVAEHAGSEYVFTWEIFVGETYRQRYIDEARMRSGKDAGGDSLVQMNKRSKSLRGKQQRRLGSKIQAPEDGEIVDSCIDQFNPQSQEETMSVVRTWTGAYLELFEEIVKKKNTTAAATPATQPADPAATFAATADWPALNDLELNTPSA